jgi:hypothetical protein
MFYLATAQFQQITMDMIPFMAKNFSSIECLAKLAWFARTRDILNYNNNNNLAFCPKQVGVG